MRQHDKAQVPATCAALDVGITTFLLLLSIMGMTASNAAYHVCSCELMLVALWMLCAMALACVRVRVHRGGRCEPHASLPAIL